MDYMPTRWHRAVLRCVALRFITGRDQELTAVSTAVSEGHKPGISTLCYGSM